MNDKSWNHTLIVLPDDDPLLGTPCSNRCVEPIRYEGSYEYVTGKRGRVSWTRRLMCAKHAEKWAQKYGLAPPGVVNTAPVQQPPQEDA